MGVAVGKAHFSFDTILFMITKAKTLSFLWQHLLLLGSLYLMTLGVVLCVKSGLGSSVISSLPFVFSLAGPVSIVPQWTIGGIYDCDERPAGTLPDTHSAAKVRAHAALSTGHRVYLRVADRPQYGTDLRIGVYDVAFAALNATGRLYGHGHRHRLRGAMRFGDYARRGYLDRHKSGRAPSFCQSQDYGGHDPRPAGCSGLLSLFRTLAVECRRRRNTIRHDLRRPRGKVHIPTPRMVRPSAGLCPGIPPLPVRIGSLALSARQRIGKIKRLVQDLSDSPFDVTLSGYLRYRMPYRKTFY